MTHFSIASESQHYIEIYESFQIMAASNSADDINLQNLKVEDSTTAKPEASGGTTAEKAAKPKKEKPKQDKPKQEKPKQEKPKQEKPQAVVEAPPEELDFNRTPEEVTKALDQWTQKPLTLNKLKSDEKM